MRMISYNLFEGGRALRIAVGIIALAILLLAGSACAVELTMDYSGGADYTRIQYVINASSSWDTIQVQTIEENEKKISLVSTERAINKGIRYLSKTQLDDGSWSGSIPSTPVNTALNILALNESGENIHNSSIQNAIGWLISKQRPDGGWASTLNPSDKSSLDTTSLVMVSLLQAGEQEDSKTITDAKQFILQNGGIENASWFTKSIISKYGAVSVDSFDIPVPLEIMLNPELFNNTITYYHQFYYVPAALTYYELKYPPKNQSPLQKAAKDVAIDWIKLHQSPDKSPLFLIALSTAGLPKNSSEIQYGARWVEVSQRSDGSWSGGRGNIIIFDTEWAIISLVQAGLNPEKNKHPQNRKVIEEAANWLLSQQYTSKGPGWWHEGSWSWSYLEIPDADDTAYGVLSLIYAGKSADSPRIVMALDFLRSFQNSDGGWPTFIKDSYGIDGSLVDVTTHTIEAFKAAGISSEDPAIQKGVMYLKGTQLNDGSWMTFWARNYTYATYNGLVGLYISGETASSSNIIKGVHWIKNNQNLDGGWGGIKGDNSTVEETSWALLALMTVGENPKSKEIQKGIKWLIDTQNPDGSWNYEFVMCDDSTCYADPVLPNTFAIRALTQYKENIKKDMWYMRYI